jgi:hypothetical protein
VSNLNPRQFGAGERLYHGSTGDHAEIMRSGLLPMPGLSNEGMLGEGVTEAIFMTPDPEEAAEYGGAVYEIDYDGLDDIEPVDGPQGYHFTSRRPIEPSRLRRWEPDGR